MLLALLFFPPETRAAMSNIIQAHDLKFKPFIQAESIAETVKKMGSALKKEYEDINPLFICVLNGAFVFAADLLRACDFPCEVTFVRLASYQGSNSTGKVTTILGLDVPIKNRHVVVVEDIVDSGLTLSHFLEELSALEPASLKLAVLLIKPDALQVELRPEYYGFQIPNEFVVGYGLDYDNLCRNLPAIYIKTDDN